MSKDNYILTPEGREALTQCIVDWERIEAGELSIDAHTCPLCKIYTTCSPIVDKDCVGCPISAYTAADNCIETPYYDAREAERDQLPELPYHVHAMVVLLKEILSHYSKKNEGKRDE